MHSIIFAFLQIFLFALANLLSVAVRAEPAYVRGSEEGQAFTFHHSGQCYAILPDHVSARSRFLMTAGTPPREGRGTMTEIRFPLADFALATVEGTLAVDCNPAWDVMPSNLGPLLPDAGLATLTKVRPNGVTERMRVVMSPVVYEHVGITPVDPAERGRIAKGWSGSLLSVDETPVGIAIDLPGGDWGAEARILRFDAMKGRLDRYLRAGPGLRNASGPVVAENNRIPFEVVGWSATPASAENTPTELAQDGGAPFLTGPLSEAVSLRLRLLSDEPTPVLGRVEIETTLDDATTPPRSVLLFAPASADDTSPRRLTSGRVQATGQGEINVGQQQTKWLDIRITDVWNPALPLRIDALRVFSP
ncbi:hypothetical protein [uncultured Jannaschia sp.]|uniref:hypothetical protein n=1 Tax=uncultured Jannaschia sp. TaxID=293347 RepID=UPI002610B2D0|nr:hypothetical protein [uncultured Jannaschia sp.]